jgi:hypothetical protein
MAALACAAPAALASTGGASQSRSALISNPDATVTPNPTAPGTATTFVVSCNSLTAGGNATAATLVGTPMGLSSEIPMQQGSQPNQFVVTVNMPQTIGAGSFSPNINCNNGVTQVVNIQVNAVPSQAPQTGDGTTSTATNGTLMVAGLGVLAAAAVVGGLVRRRRSDHHI